MSKKGKPVIEAVNENGLTAANPGQLFAAFVGKFLDSAFASDELLGDERLPCPANLLIENSVFLIPATSCFLSHCRIEIQSVCDLAV